MIESGRIAPLKVLVKEPRREEEVKKSGIIIPHQVENKPAITGKVVMVGDSTEQTKAFVRIGENILFSPHAPVKVKIDDEDYLLLNQTDVLFIWT